MLVPTLIASNDTAVGLNLCPGFGVIDTAMQCPAVFAVALVVGVNAVKAGVYSTGDRPVSAPDSERILCLAILLPDSNPVETSDIAVSFPFSLTCDRFSGSLICHVAVRGCAKAPRAHMPAIRHRKTFFILVLNLNGFTSTWFTLVMICKDT